MAYKHSTNAMKNLSIMMLLGAFFTLWQSRTTAARTNIFENK